VREVVAGADQDGVQSLLPARGATHH
jgi:hypothetical protein